MQGTFWNEALWSDLRESVEARVAPGATTRARASLQARTRSNSIAGDQISSRRLRRYGAGPARGGPRARAGTTSADAAGALSSVLSARDTDAS